MGQEVAVYRNKSVLKKSEMKQNEFEKTKR